MRCDMPDCTEAVRRFCQMMATNLKPGDRVRAVENVNRCPLEEVGLRKNKIYTVSTVCAGNGEIEPSVILNENRLGTYCPIRFRKVK